MEFIVLSEEPRGIKELISAAKAQSASIITAVAFDEETASEAASCGASRAIKIALADGACKEEAASVIIDIAKAAGQATVLVSSTRRLVNAAGRIAQALGTVPVADVKKISDNAAAHLVFGGKVLLSEKPEGAYSVFIMQGGAYEACADAAAPCPIEAVRVEGSAGIKVLERKPKESATVDLSAAKRIVCIGRGVNSQEGFEICKDLKDALGAEMGCTRPVTETENPLMPRETYIGASGVICKPSLYVAVAASGQTQHTVGMYESGTIVAIDKNKDALFFQMCDYGIVGDYTEIVPAITRALGA